MSRLARGGTAEPVSRDQILRRERGQGNIHFPRSADHVQDWQPYPVDLYTLALCLTHIIYICCSLQSPKNESPDSRNPRDGCVRFGADTARAQRPQRVSCLFGYIMLLMVGHKYARARSQDPLRKACIVFSLPSTMTFHGSQCVRRMEYFVRCTADRWFKW